MILQLLRRSTIYAIWLSSVVVAHPFRRQLSDLSLTAITALSEAEIDAFTPYTWYASTGYCQPSEVLTWSCGANCEANPSFHPLFAGGDGVNVQYWYVGYDTSLDTVIVAHQGTNPVKILPLVTDGVLAMGSLDSTLFPGLPATIQVHEGFRNEQARTAPDILMAVEGTLIQSKMTKVTVVGHSLGAAIALLDSVYLPLHIPGVTFETVVYGLPRVGNQDFATYVNGNANLTHINNKEDPIPTVPGMFMGYHQPQGERHIEDDNSWVFCPGGDNPSTMCSTGDVPTVFEGKLSDHDGEFRLVIPSGTFADFFDQKVRFEMDRSIFERWLATMLKKPNPAALTAEERAFVIHEVWEIIQHDRWCLLASGGAPRISGFEVLNLYPMAILVTRHIPIIGLKDMTVKDAPEVLLGPQEELARDYLATQGISSSEYNFHVNLHCVDMF